jgi:hypothetical protein
VHADSKQDFRMKQFIANAQRRIDLDQFAGIIYIAVAANFLQAGRFINASQVPPSYVQAGREDHR